MPKLVHKSGSKLIKNLNNCYSLIVLFVGNKKNYYFCIFKILEWFNY
jgi:hypothetical protein